VLAVLIAQQHCLCAKLPIMPVVQHTVGRCVFQMLQSD
jgi:hypothetical protein